MANGKSWTETDMQRLTELYSTMKAADVAQKMGRNINSVRAMAYKLGLKSENFDRWSESDHNFIVANWGALTPDEIALHLGRTKASVQSHATIHRLTKKKKALWTPEQEGQLEELWGVKNIPQIAKIMSRSEWSITIKANRMGLGAFKDYGEYIPAYRISRMLDVDLRKVKKWMQEYGLKSKRIAPSGTKKFTYIRFSHLLDWLRKNPDKWDSRRIKLFDIGLEPNWLKEKRKSDACLSDRSRQKWTPQEDSTLIAMVESGKYTHRQISDRVVGRSVAAVEHRIKRINKLRRKGGDDK